MAARGGVNLIWGAGNLESHLAMSPETLVADDEIIGYFLLTGKCQWMVNLALDEIKGLGIAATIDRAPYAAHYRNVLSRARLAVARAGQQGAKGARVSKLFKTG
jgi:hypothetical protein